MKSKSKAEIDLPRLAVLSANPVLPTGVEPAADVAGKPTRILIADDHPVVRKGLTACLSRRSNLVVVGEASDGIEAVKKVAELGPDLVLMDVEMPVMDGLAATEAICRKYPETKVLVISMHNNAGNIVRAIQAGARGFELKTTSSENILKAIDIVQRGEPFFPGQQPTAKNPTVSPDGLFEREKEVLVYLAMGYSNRDIAALLTISIRTVESHRARLMRKLGIHTIAGLTRYALSKGYISLNQEATVLPGSDAAFGIAPVFQNSRI